MGRYAAGLAMLVLFVVVADTIAGASDGLC